MTPGNSLLQIRRFLAGARNDIAFFCREEEEGRFAQANLPSSSRCSQYSCHPERSEGSPSESTYLLPRHPFKWGSAVAPLHRCASAPFYIFNSKLCPGAGISTFLNPAASILSAYFFWVSYSPCTTKVCSTPALS
jgi:hypothetical protein